MIFATVGTQLPFPRFMRLVDKLAHKHKLKVFAQTADPAATLSHVCFSHHLTPQEFQMRAQSSRLIVGHAGVGTVITGLSLRKPLVLFPRRAHLSEHRNDHQISTAKALEGVQGIYIAWCDSDLEELLIKDDLQSGMLGLSPRRDQLITRIKLFMQNSSEPPDGPDTPHPAIPSPDKLGDMPETKICTHEMETITGSPKRE